MKKCSKDFRRAVALAPFAVPPPLTQAAAKGVAPKVRCAEGMPGRLCVIGKAEEAFTGGHDVPGRESAAIYRRQKPSGTLRNRQAYTGKRRSSGRPARGFALRDKWKGLDAAFSKIPAYLYVLVEFCGK